MKKFLSLVLALVIVLGTFGNVALADEEKLEYTTQEAKIQWLIDKEIVIGRKVNADGSAELDLDETLTRAEVTKLIVYTLKLQNLADALKGVMKPFPDVDIDHWANGYVSVATTQREDVAFGRRIVIGYEDGKFYPENNVTYAELATMLVRIVKEDLTPQMERDAIWATSYMRWAEEEGILKGITVLDSDKPVTRRDAFEMIFNAMYALGDYNKAAIDFGDDIGIVSKLRDGILEINQEKEYKVTKDTVITDGTTWASLGDNAEKVWAGSLVRYIVNEDNEVTHLIELGKPLEYNFTNNNGAYVFRGGPTNLRGWRGIIDSINDVVSGYGYFNVDASGKFRDLLVETGVDKNNNPVYFGLEIDKDTRLFVADVHNNALKELKSLDEVFNYWSLADGFAGLLYAGYDEYSTRVGGAKTDVALAKVVVFNDVDKYQGYDEVRRVTDWLNSAKRYQVEDTKGNKEALTIEKLSAFPSILLDEIDYKDVVRIKEGAHDPYSLRDVVEVIIDYSEDPVFEVAKVSDRLITLRDEDGYEREFAIDRDAYIFLEGELKKGAHVQVAWDSPLSNKYRDQYLTGDDLFRYDVLKYFSVVDKDLEGELEEGIRKGTDSGYIIKISDYAGQIDTVAITIADKLNGRNPRSYLVSREDLPFFYNIAKNNPEDVIGEEVIFEIVRRFGADYVFAVEFKMTQDEQDLLREIQELELGAIANDTDLENAKRLLARAAGMKDLPPNVAAAVAGLKEEVEGYVKVSFTTSKGSLEGTSEYWVLKDEEVDLTAPTVTGLTDYEFKAWDPEIKTTYSEDTVHKATFTYTGEDVVPQPGEDKPDVPENFVLVEFKAGEHGTLEGTTKYWVNPEAGKKVSDLTKPTVTPEENWKHTGWDKEDATEITKELTVTAEYKAKVVTEDPQDEDYVKVDFATTKGTVEGQAEYWVLKDEAVTFDVPTVDLTGVEGYEFKAWDPVVAESYLADTIHNATF